MHDLRLDLAVAWRTLRRTPGTTLLAVLVLGLGIGANSSMFSLVNTLLLRPLAIPESQEMSLILRHDTERRDYSSASYPDFVDLRNELESFSGVTAHNLAMVGIGEGSETRRSFVDLIAANYFSTFEVAPAAGRAFTLEEERPGAAIPVIMLSYIGWQRMGGSDDILGTQIPVNGIDMTIVGVAPKGFSGTSSLLAPELYAPLGMSDRLSDSLSSSKRGSMLDRDNGSLLLVGRFADDTSRGAANAELTRVSNGLAAEYPGSNRDVVYEAHPPSRISISTSPQEDDELGVLAALLLGMSLLVLVVAGFNLASVQGARNIARRREIAVRLALGSGRFGIVRQLVLEALLLALGGALVGLAIASVAPRLLARSLSNLAPFDVFLDGSLDWRIISATVGFALFAALLVGLFPALRATRPNLSADLKEGRAGADGAQSAGVRRFGLNRADLPVVAELALSMVLLVCAGLFVTSALRGANVRPGFEVDQQVLLEIDPALVGYDEVRAEEVRRRLRDELRLLPAVRDTAYASATPFGMVSFGVSVIDADRPLSSEEDQGQSAAFYTVSDSYFSTMEIPLLNGREFDRVEPRPVAIIDQTLAERLFDGGPAVGRLISFKDDDRLPTPAEVVGVVASVRDSLFDRRRPAHVYLPASRHPVFNTQIHIATFGSPDATTLAAVRQTAAQVDDNLPLLTLRPFREFLQQSFEVWTLRTAAQLFSVFAALALALAVAGIYGVQAYRVAQRTREIGVRMALGASVRNTVALILGDGARVALVGTTVGALFAVGAAQAFRVVLVDVSPADPVTLVLAWLLLIAVASGACVVPALQAARLDPVRALSEE